MKSKRLSGCLCVCFVQWALAAVIKLWPSQRAFPKTEEKKIGETTNEALTSMQAYTVLDFVCKADEMAHWQMGH